MMFETIGPEACAYGNSNRILLASFPTDGSCKVTQELEGQGYGVVAAKSADQARRMFETMAFDFVVVDVANIDVFAPRFIHQLRGSRTPSPNFTVVAVDSSGLEGLRLQLTQSGADLVVRKFRFSDLSANIRHKYFVETIPYRETKT